MCAVPAPSKLGKLTVTSRFDGLISTLAGLFKSTLAGLKSSEIVIVKIIKKYVNYTNQ